MMINRGAIEAILKDIKGRALEQLGKWLKEPELEDAGKAARTRSKIQRAVATKEINPKP